MGTRFRRLAAVTTALTYVLVLLGLYTGATAGGLSCDARWPLCNGAVFGLFPANWASFFEWSHRFVAMVVGILLVGTLYGAWRWQDDRRVAWLLTGAVVLLPVQVGLGAVTTTAGGAFPGGFNPVVIATHFVTAAVIFSMLVVATLLVYGTPGRRRRRHLLASMGLLGVVHAVFDVTGLVPFFPRYQVVFYGASYALLAAFLGVATWALRRAGPSAGSLGARVGVVGALAVVVDMVLSRRLFGLTEVLSYGTTAFVFLVVLALVWLETRTAGADGAVPTAE